MCSEPLRHLVLLVDDKARTALRLAQMLREDGFDVEVVTDGRVALGRLARDPVPDVLVTEWLLRNASGHAVAKRARRTSPSVPVVVVTGYPQLALAATDLTPRPIVIAKPALYADLVQHLRTATGCLP